MTKQISPSKSRANWWATTKVVAQTDMLMGSEDFAFMLQQRPGTFLRIGNGVGEDGCMVAQPALRLQRPQSAGGRRVLDASCGTVSEPLTPGRAATAPVLQRCSPEAQPKLPAHHPRRATISDTLCAACRSSSRNAFTICFAELRCALPLMFIAAITRLWRLRIGADKRNQTAFAVPDRRWPSPPAAHLRDQLLSVLPCPSPCAA